MKMKNRDSISVKRQFHTTARHNNGLSRQEVERVNEGFFFFNKLGMPLFWGVLGDSLLDKKPDEARPIIQSFKANLVQAQARAGFPQFWLETIEATGGMHANIVFVGTETIAQRLCSGKFSQFMQTGYGEGNAMQAVHDAAHLEKYLTKELTSQANYAMGFRHDGRIRSQKLACGGDRVNLSKALKAEGIKSGIIKPWLKKNAKVNARAKPAKAAATTIQPTGQLLLFPELENPIARLKNFNAGILSPSAAMEMEHRRKRRGLSQRQLGAIANVSQPQLANAIGGRFGLSRKAANRIKAVLFSEAA